MRSFTSVQDDMSKNSFFDMYLFLFVRKNKCTNDIEEQTTAAEEDTAKPDDAHDGWINAKEVSYACAYAAEFLIGG